MNLIKSILSTKISRFIIISFIFVIVSTVAVFLKSLSDILWLRMVWNYFLAVIPAYMALFALHFSEKGKRIQEFIFMLLWLLFFPNSLYMITDYKYLSNYNIDLWGNFTAVSDNLAPWILLANLIISVTLGILVGLMSLEIIHNLLKKQYSGKVCWCIITVISLLSSFGIYIGRYARLNSWDIINPVKIILKSLDVLTPFAPIYILIFTLLTMILYCGYRYFLYTLKGISKVGFDKI